MIDTHTHLYLSEFDDDPACVSRALDAGISDLVLPNIDLSTVDRLERFCDTHVGVSHAAYGLHPTSVNDGWRDALAGVRKALEASHHNVAVGEVGMDLYWDKTFAAEQMACFREQIAWARDLSLPVIIHCREALDETLAVLRGFGGHLPQLIFHSFTGSSDDVSRIREVADAWFGINGVVTFKNARPLRDALPGIGIERMLLETDSPYLAPAPHRGKRNESAWVADVCAKIADTLGLEFADVDRLTSANARYVFSLPQVGL